MLILYWDFKPFVAGDKIPKLNKSKRDLKVQTGLGLQKECHRVKVGSVSKSGINAFSFYLLLRPNWRKNTLNWKIASKWQKYATKDNFCVLCHFLNKQAKFNFDYFISKQNLVVTCLMKKQN